MSMNKVSVDSGNADDKDISTPLDFQNSIFSNQGNSDLYINVISRFEVLQICPKMTDIKHALDKKCRDKFKDAVSALMKSCELIGAGQVVNACRYILESLRNSTAGFVTGYPELIEVVIELKRHIRKYLT